MKMKRIIFDSEFRSKHSEEAVREMLVIPDLILMGITTENGGKKASEFLVTLDNFIPLRYGRKEDEPFYKNEASKFISGTARENAPVDLLIEESLFNFRDAVKRDEFMFDNIGEVIIVTDNDNIPVIAEDGEIIKNYSILKTSSLKTAVKYLHSPELFSKSKTDSPGIRFLTFKNPAGK